MISLLDRDRPSANTLRARRLEEVCEKTFVLAIGSDIVTNDNFALIAHPLGIIQGVDHLLTGNVGRVDADLLQSLPGYGVVPVIPPLGFDGEGRTCLQVKKLD
jgi:acetylglutamate kinase